MIGRVTIAPHPTEDRLVITVEFPDAAIVARDDGTVAVGLDDRDWKETARRVLKAFNAGERHLSPAAMSRRVREALATALERAEPILNDSVAQRRSVSTVLHRLADMVQSGSLDGVDVEWDRDSKNPMVVVSWRTCVGAPETEVMLLTAIGSEAKP